jgi:organic hydroperoxide reductase OsmC/OhrA
MDTIKPLFTATATATGGRNGHTESSDHVVLLADEVQRAAKAARRERRIGADGWCRP